MATLFLYGDLMAFNNTNLTQDSYMPNVTYLDTSNNNSTNYADAGIADEIGSGAGTGIGAYFGGPIGAMIGSAAGNAIGTGINYLAAEGHADNQFEKQTELQSRAFQLNQAAQRYQAQNEKQSLERAGMNPSQASANGAPTIQPGAAGLASSQMANIFDGLSELIVAAKAPSEISKIRAEEGKIEAEIGKVDAETDKIISAEIPNIQQNTKKLVEDTRNVKNMNDVFDAHQAFLKDTSPGIFDGYRANLKVTGQWEELPSRTRATIDSLADGEIELGVGELQGLNEVIDAQGKLSQRDKDVLRNMLDSIVAIRQLKDDTVKAALARLPVAEFDRIYATVRDLYASANLKDAQKAATLLDSEIRKLTTPQYMIEHGMSDQAEQDQWIKSLEGIREMFLGIAEVGGTGLISGGIGGAVGSKMATKGAIIPREYQNLQKTRGTFIQYFDRGPDGNFYPVNSKNWK